nr:MAG TPA: hypothetical protein [Caudoviricetes sp.]DAL90462.1 MAG TPA: hypothetical protein [Caudoviricetes sp.]DAM97627.1 MAG TPA: hypothetical protein [Caudoviricetes sp.]DAQ68590.1 MAG TPA: hypothetical protein [Caudoviricetes sp.]DAV58489.1 MAG TPA: hypothetical protein [Caudoviricetes sp.]
MELMVGMQTILLCCRWQRLSPLPSLKICSYCLKVTASPGQ